MLCNLKFSVFTFSFNPIYLTYIKIFICFAFLLFFYESFTLLKQVAKYLFIIFIYMHEFMYTTCIQEPVAAERGHWILLI